MRICALHKFAKWEGLYCTQVEAICTDDNGLISSLLKYIAKCLSAKRLAFLFAERMAEYFYGNNGVSEKLRSAEWGFERRNGELYGCITVQTAGPLTEDEEQDLKEWISGQNSDGLGEGFEQREIYFEGGHRGAFMYVSFWCPDDDYFIDNQDEFEDRLMNQDMTMGGM